MNAIKKRSLFDPFRAWGVGVGVIPGRCPGLICCALSALVSVGVRVAPDATEVELGSLGVRIEEFATVGRTVWWASSQ